MSQATANFTITLNFTACMAPTAPGGKIPFQCPPQVSVARRPVSVV